MEGNHPEKDVWAYTPGKVLAYAELIRNQQLVNLSQLRIAISGSEDAAKQLFADLLPPRPDWTVEIG